MNIQFIIAIAIAFVVGYIVGLLHVYFTDRDLARQISEQSRILADEKARWQPVHDAAMSAALDAANSAGKRDV
jgi:uncharacterized membrane-anchored protein YhcB (DUF1043 family)